MLNKIICGECSEVLSEFPSDFIDLVITSPPYDNLRKYQGYTFDCKQIASALFKVLKPGGVVVWVVGDAVFNGGETGTSFRQALIFQETGFLIHDTMIFQKNSSSFPARRDGKRYSQIFEFMFIFSKGRPKTAHLLCDKPNRWKDWTSWGQRSLRDKDGKLQPAERIKPIPEFSPRNNIWKYSVGAGYSTKDKIAFEHPAIFPEGLAKDHILSWTNEEDIVLDCMCGSGTTCKVAKSLKRNYIGIDISKEYCELSERRISGLDVKR